MRTRVLRLVAVAALLLSMAGCTDAPTMPGVEPRADGTPPDPSADQQSTAALCCDEVIVIVPGGPVECNPYTSLDWCEGGGDCMTSQPPETGDPDAMTPAAGSSGCPGGGGTRPPPGGTIPPGEPLPGDTCNTGNPMFDSRAVEQGMKDLWTLSNPTAPQSQRLEQAAWIIQDPAGSYRMVSFGVGRQGPCEINGNFNPPPGAVAWVHTHPFARGEVQTICGPLRQPDPSAPGGFRVVTGPNGQPVYPVYRNNPSVPDRRVMNAMNNTMAQVGRPKLDGVVIDANHATVYSGNAGKATTPYPRCTY